jgi:hypothetical protein
MGYGVLDSSQEIVPGTIQLYDSVVNAENTQHLKHSGDGITILAPQPSDSPNDPLNWPLWRKDFVFSTLALSAILSGVHNPILGPITLELVAEFNTSLTAVAQLSSYMLLLIALVAYLDAALCHVYGKRAVFVVSMAVLMASDAWAAASSSYGSLLGARILSGAGQAAFEALSLSVVSDLYFVHQRGLRIGAFIVAFETGVYLSVPIDAQIIGRSGWKMAFAGLAISEAVVLIILFLFFHEPSYKRVHVDPLANMSEKEILEHINDTTGPPEQEVVESVAFETETRRTFFQNLKLYNGRFSRNNPLVLLYRSVILTLHPTILWVALNGIALGWPAGVSYTAAAFLTLPPYNFGAQGIADIYIAAWIGAILALIIGTPVFGTLAKWLARKNKNVYEPEFLLFQLIPGIIITSIGYVGWGWGEQVDTAWIGLACFFAMMNGGAVMVNNCVIAYILDAHREYAEEAMVIVFAIKVILAYTYANQSELFPLRSRLLFCSLVDQCWPKNRLGCLCSSPGRNCPNWDSCLHLWQEDACVLESAPLPKSSRHPTALASSDTGRLMSIAAALFY